jgi:hypothetical protein
MQASRRKATWFNMQKLVVNNYALGILVLKHCQQVDLVLNWEKCQFMVREGIVLGHKISEKGIEVDKAKIVVIEQFQPPTNVKGIHSFLEHAGFL